MGLLDRFKRPPAPVLSVQFEAWLRGWEGSSLVPYKDSAGKWTIGVGHLMNRDEPRKSITREQETILLQSDWAVKAAGVSSLVKIQLTTNQTDAIVAFAFNLGVGALNGSTLLKLVNAGQLAVAANEFGKWCNEHDPVSGRLRKVEGLVKRRAAERAMFVFGDYSGRP